MPSKFPLPPVLGLTSASAFVGRRVERDALDAAWERVRAGQRQLVLVSGEPGIGKTRLATEFALEAHRDGGTILFGRCDEENLVPYQPFVEALRHYVVACPPEQLLDRLGRSPGDLARIIPEVRQRLRALPAPFHGEPETERYALFGAIASLLVESSRVDPVVLILDDLHWADKPTLLLLRHVVRFSDPAAVLFVCTYRDTELGRTHPLAATLTDLRREVHVHRVTLRGLEAGDVADLVARSGHEWPPSLVQAVHEQTEGNPFFVGEVLRHLSESGQAVDAAGLPEGIKEVVGRRLSRLGDPVNRVLAVAAVIGREFDVDLLERLVDLGADELLDALEIAMNARVIREMPEAVGRYRFSHALIRETLYGELLIMQRVRLHRQIATALEALTAGRADQPLGELAYHFLQAAPGGDADRAVDYATRAGQQAMRVLAYEEAATHYEHALQTFELLDVRSDRRQCELLLALGDALARAGETARAKETLERAADLAERLGLVEHLADAALSFGAAGVTASVVEDRLVRLCERALRALPEEDSARRAKVLARLAAELYFSREADRRAALSTEAVEMARRLDDPEALAAALSARHYVLWGPGELDERLDIGREILSLADRTGDRELALHGHRWLIIDLLEIGDMEAVDREMDAHAALADQVRQPLYVWWTLVFQAMRHLLEGRFDDGWQVAQKAFDVGRRVNDAALQFFGLQTSVVLRERGLLQGLEAGARGMAEQFPAVPAWRCAMAVLFADLGKLEEARAELEDLAANDFQDFVKDLSWLPAITALSDVCVFVGDRDRAVQLYDLLLPFADHNVVVGAAVACYGSASRQLGRLAALLGRPDEAAARFRAAIDLHRRMRARPLEAHTELDLARLLLEVGDDAAIEEARGLLDHVLATADELGMDALLAKAREL